METTDAGSPGRSAGNGGALPRRPQRRRRFAAAGLLLCLLLASVGAAAGLWWAAERGDQQATAQAVVLVRPLEGNAFNPSSTGTDLVNMETESQLVESSVVTGLAAKRLGDTTGAELREGLSVTVPPNTQLVEVAAQGADAQEAVDRAQVLSKTFLAFRSDRAESDLFDRRARLQEQIRGREQQRREIVVKLGRAAQGSNAAVVRQQQITDLTTQLGELRVQLAELDASSTDPGQVVTTAEAMSPSLLGRAWVLAALGALIGLALGLILLGGRRRLDEHVHGPEDLAHVGVPVLGRLPGPADERPRAVGGMRAALLAAHPDRPLVIGVAAGASADTDGCLEATAELTGELGLALRRSGMVVAVLDLASRGSSPTGVGGGPDSPLLALSTLLEAQQDVSEVLARRRASGRALAIVNDLGDDAMADRAASPEMASLLAALRQVADAVVVDMGSLEDTGAQSLADAVDAVVLTVREGSSTFGELEGAIERLPLWGGRLAGMVCVAGGAARRGAATSTAAPDATAGRTSDRGPSAAEAMRPASGGGTSSKRISTLLPEERW